jgi:hypothetical protein
MDIYNASATLPPEDFAAFTNTPRKVIIKPPGALYRFATIISPTFEGSRTFDSPWWIPPRTFRRITKAAYRSNKSIIAVAREGLAVLPAWNPAMDWLIIVELKQPVYGWIGPARRQWLPSRERPGFLPGNYVQAYVPGLAPKDATSSQAAMLTYYGSADGE